MLHDWKKECVIHIQMPEAEDMSVKIVIKCWVSNRKRQTHTPLVPSYDILVFVSKTSHRWHKGNWHRAETNKLNLARDVIIYPILSKFRVVLYRPHAILVTFAPRSSATSRGRSSSLRELCPSCPYWPEPNVNSAWSWGNNQAFAVEAHHASIYLWHLSKYNWYENNTAFQWDLDSPSSEQQCALIHRKCKQFSSYSSNEQELVCFCL